MFVVCSVYASTFKLYQLDEQEESSQLYDNFFSTKPLTLMLHLPHKKLASYTESICCQPHKLLGSNHISKCITMEMDTASLYA